MYTDFDKNIKPEYIMLSDLKNYNKDFHEEYYYISGMNMKKSRKILIDQRRKLNPK